MFIVPSLFLIAIGVVAYASYHRTSGVTGLARISHRISRQVGQDVAPDSFSNARGRCPKDCEKCGPDAAKIQHMRAGK